VPPFPPVPAGLIDLDRAATTPLSEAARLAMEPFLGAAGPERTRHGNPSGSHAIARDALRAVDEAREVVAGVLGCRPGEVVFTSGGTEADNHAVTGGMPPRPGVAVCSAVEHHAVLEPTAALGGVVVAVDRLGRVDLAALGGALDGVAESGRQVACVSVMAANNEVGTCNDLSSVAEVVDRHAPGAVLHTDAVQAAPWLDLAQLARDADLVSVSAHKLGGPKGTGALVVRRGVALAPLLHGGSQERDLRGGTQDVAGIVGFAAALAARAGARDRLASEVGRRRDRLAEAVAAGVPDVEETVGPAVRAALGEPADRSHLLPGHLHLCIGGVDAEELLLVLEQEGVCASAGSSCASGALGGSHVMAALGVAGPGTAPLRLSLGEQTTDDDVDRAAAALVAAVQRVRAARTGPDGAGVGLR
jgi:cysteine desulfurase